MGTWTNGDGLYLKFGTNEGTAGRGGEVVNYGGTHIIEFELDLTVLATATQTILSDTVVIPNGALLEKVIITVEEVSAGANANLDLGLVDQDRTTEIDFNGLLAASDGWHAADIGTIEEFVQGSTEHGALLGTVLTNTGLVTANADTAVFTDGTLKIVIEYSIP